MGIFEPSYKAIKVDGDEIVVESRKNSKRVRISEIQDIMVSGGGRLVMCVRLKNRKFLNIYGNKNLRDMHAQITAQPHYFADGSLARRNNIAFFIALGVFGLIFLIAWASGADIQFSSGSRHGPGGRTR